MTATIRPIRSTLEQRAIPLPLTAADKLVREAHRAGVNEGERMGYIAGWRWGTLCGFLLGLLVGGGAVAAAQQLGRMVG